VTDRVGYWEDLSARTATGTEGHQVYVEGQGKEIDKTAGVTNTAWYDVKVYILSTEPTLIAHSLRMNITHGLPEMCTVAELSQNRSLFIADWLIDLTIALPLTLAQHRHRDRNAVSLPS